MLTDPAKAVAPRADPGAVDPYAAPSATLVDVVPARTAPRHYVVSPAKFWTLELLSFGLYGYYWTYRQWQAIKRASRGDEWPVMRSLFQIFYFHSLTADIDQALRRAGIRHAWAPGSVATGAVVTMLAAGVLGRLPDTALPDSVFMAAQLGLVVVVAGLKSRIQAAANAACGDAGGRGNARFTGANIAWIVGFALLWLTAAAGVLLPAPQ
jgi:hypothetical protein